MIENRFSIDNQYQRNQFTIAEAEGTLPPHDGCEDQWLN